MATATAALQRVRASSLIDVIGLLLLGGVIVWLLFKFFEDPTRFLNVAVIGVTNGAIYGLVALGYTLVYGILQLINFAHGDVFALSGLVASTMIVSVFGLDESSSAIVIVLGLLATLAVTMPLFALVNATIERDRLQAAPQRAPARAPDHRRRRVLHRPEHLAGASTASTSSPCRTSSPGPRPSRNRRRRHPVEQARRVPDRHPRARSSLTWFVRSTRQGKAMRAVAQDTRGLGDDGHQRQPDDLGDVLPRRRARGGRRARLPPPVQHALRHRASSSG